MKRTLILSLLTIFIACAPVGHTTIININDLARLSENDLIYSLPQTRIRIDITAVQHSTIPGPYSAFAEKYLGFTGVPAISKTNWELLHIEVSELEEPDPDYCFSVRTNKTVSMNNQIDILMTKGLITATHDYYSYFQFYPHLSESPEPYHFPDMSVKPTIEKDIRKSNQKSEQGVVSNNYTAVRNSADIKELETRAEEAADFIIKLRKRRFKLMVGQDQPVPDGVALETSSKELRKIENEYISLFIGKTYSDTIQKVFIYTPKANQEMERSVICRFSEEQGIQEESNTKGIELVLEIRNLKYTEPMKNTQMPSSGPDYSDILLYRMPEKASAQIFFGSAIILDAELKIFQYGPLLSVAIAD
jgi:hypothetical protein